MALNFHNLQITRLGNHSAPACRDLAARTFGMDSPLFQVVYDFTKEKRAGYLATIRNCVAGFIIYDNRDMEVAQILALAVRKSDRREGIGRQLLSRVIRLPRKEIFAHVDERNLDVQLFLQSQGFRAVSVEHGTPDYYLFKRSNGTVTELKSSLQTAGVLT
jgi:ribosomal protein S18 acetylase RimI-like enzyme